MNLPDLLRRKDRAWFGQTGGVALVDPQVAGRRYRGIELMPGASFGLRNAHEFTVLRDLPSDLHLQVVGATPAGGVKVTMNNQSDGQAYTVAHVAADPAGVMETLLFDWPAAAGWSGYDLRFEQIGPGPTTIVVGPLVNPRRKFAPFIAGRGVEVGPGVNPYVSPDVADVTYIEEKHPDHWISTYAGGTATAERLTPEVLARFRVANAVTLEEFADATLDFIFSNHVFEHLHNPLGVLANWHRKLRPGGVILGATPDARGCFDLRQPLSQREEFITEFAEGSFVVPDAKYDRWCRYTAPGGTVESLKARNYSVHAHYYTPAVFRDLVDLLNAQGAPCSLFLETVSNNKDFGFIIRI